MEREKIPDRPNRVQGRTGDTIDQAHGDDHRSGNRHSLAVHTIGWEPSCKCPEHVPVPCTVLDTFSGSATTGYKANRLGRDYIGLDLNPGYLPLAEARILGNDPLDDDGAAPAESILDLFGA